MSDVPVTNILLCYHRIYSVLFFNLFGKSVPFVPHQHRCEIWLYLRVCFLFLFFCPEVFRIRVSSSLAFRKKISNNSPLPSKLIPGEIWNNNTPDLTIIETFNAQVFAVLVGLVILALFVSSPQPN
jgi:hypothetical protein